MNLIDIDDKNFRDIYQNNEIVVLDFWAIWCGPCQQFTPVYEAVSKEYPDIIFGKIETENNHKLSKYFHVRSIPTIMIIRDGLEMFRHSGSLSDQDLKSFIEQVIAADMAEVEKEIENSEK